MAAEKIKVNKTLKFQLTAEDKATKAFEAAKHESAIGRLKEERKKLNAEIKDHDGSRKNLLLEVETGEEERSVQCEVVKNFDENQVEYYYKGDLKECREMTEADRQEEMNLQPKKKPKAVRRPRAASKENVVQM